MLKHMINLRQQQEEFETQYLSPFAAKSSIPLGRFEYKEPCIIRTDSQRDHNRIIHSKAFRRLKHKTQVFISPQSNHYQTRLTHTLEVSQIARALKSKANSTKSIAMDHTQFGHIGENVFNSLLTNGFNHKEQRCRELGN